VNRSLVWILLFSAVAAAVVVRFLPRRERATVAQTPSDAQLADELPMLWDAPAFEFESHAGRKLVHDELRGQVWIANFIFTECTSICPTMTAKMVLLQRSLSAPQLRFVSFSVDPENDTPQVLGEYAKDWSPAETRWWLLATDPENLTRVAKGFGVTVQKTDDLDDPILHSNRFFLVDPRGMIRGAYLSDDDEAMERLVSDANKLLAREFPSSHAAHADLPGPELFGALGCAGCHDDPRLGPPLAGVFERAVKLADGGELRADEAYLRESIVAPEARIVDGYRGTMPSYAGVLGDAQIERLIEHLKGLAAPTEAQATPTLAFDPVCKMEVTVFDDSPSTQHEGVRYWFCCEHCQEQFVANPARFAAKKP
jgi:protein SCO1/2